MQERERERESARERERERKCKRERDSCVREVLTDQRRRSKKEKEGKKKAPPFLAKTFLKPASYGSATGKQTRD